MRRESGGRGIESDRVLGGGGRIRLGRPRRRTGKRILGWLFAGKKRLPAVERRCFAVGEGELRVDGWSKKEELSAVAVQGKTDEKRRLVR
jgi:hypothetical protein